MTRTTLRLPESLYETLTRQAELEGVSLNQYMVYALPRIASVEAAASQRARFDQLRSRVAPDEAEASLHALLDDREGGEEPQAS